jgi:hypothetical protein
MAEILSLCGSVFAILSMTIYFLQVVKGTSKPNPATWIIWLIVGVINLITYFYVVEGGVLRTGVLVVVTSGIAAVTIYSLIYGKFSRLSLTDSICLILAGFVVVFWQTTGDPVRANLILQIVYAVSFIPTIIGLHKGTLVEKHLPWSLAIGAYCFMLLAVIVDWHKTHWVALAHPIINGLIGNGIVAYYAVRNMRLVGLQSDS